MDKNGLNMFLNNAKIIIKFLTQKVNYFYR
jgi:hypothetical protein